MRWSRAWASVVQRSALALGVLACAGCGPKNPRLNVLNAQVYGAAIGLPPRVLLNVVVDAYNPNSFNIQVRGVRGQTSLMNGRYRVPISVGLGNWLTSDQTTRFAVPVEIPIDLAVALLRDSALIACIPYQVNGVADVTATSTFKLERDNYPLQQSGCIPRQAMIDAVRSVNPLAFP